jgi:hypothetical protein
VRSVRPGRRKHRSERSERGAWFERAKLSRHPENLRFSDDSEARTVERTGAFEAVDSLRPSVSDDHPRRGEKPIPDSYETPAMVHCPECEATLDAEQDVDFVEMAAESGIFAASKRFYVVACDECGAAIGGGVAGAKA